MLSKCIDHFQMDGKVLKQMNGKEPNAPQILFLHKIRNIDAHIVRASKTQKEMADFSKVNKSYSITILYITNLILTFISIVS